MTQVVVPEAVATEGVSLTQLNKPVLLEEEGVISNCESPKVLLIVLGTFNVGVA